MWRADRPALYNLLTDPEFQDKGEYDEFVGTFARRKVGIVPIYGLLFCRKPYNDRSSVQIPIF